MVESMDQIAFLTTDTDTDNARAVRSGYSRDCAAASVALAFQAVSNVHEA